MSGRVQWALFVSAVVAGAAMPVLAYERGYADGRVAGRLDAEGEPRVTVCPCALNAEQLDAMVRDAMARPETLVRVRCLLVPAWCAEVVQSDLDGARAALEFWARTRRGGQCQRAGWCCKPNRHRGACLRRVV